MIILHFDTIFLTAIDISADSCWFCLSSKNITKHLIVSIGNQVFSILLVFTYILTNNICTI